MWNRQKRDLAWLVPVFYSVLGLGLVVLVVRKWAV